ncbi:hypothetical protein SAMN04487905_10836 [Actinopolyspora xinjiangensis]|uniref:Secreted protein n=1 Tax=Actinopolyspora xinjiangensis TaxID=405564 RepID=A0A1H0V632_9ACTN|nr:hypothetical protein [Actinopolyspora xinjiangensis]SDP73999.1 hypothetical protein SAMN04487905_10836 [Actinopolyspora xinjiangensis]
MHHEHRSPLNSASTVSVFSRRWSTALASTLALVVVLAPSAMATTPSPFADRASGTVPVSRAAADGTDEPDLPPKVIKTEPHQAVEPDAVPSVAPSGADTSGWWPEEPGTRPAGADGPAGARIGCNPVADSDNPHLSGNRTDVSAHAWWYQGDCDNDRATVTACLYEWYTDNTWRRKACDTNGNQKPGRSSSRWLNVRESCDSFERTSWRAHVDVDVNWEVDNPGVSTREADVNCRVFG